MIKKDFKWAHNHTQKRHFKQKKGYTAFLQFNLNSKYLCKCNVELGLELKKEEFFRGPDIINQIIQSLSDTYPDFHNILLVDETRPFSEDENDYESVWSKLNTFIVNVDILIAGMHLRRINC